MRIAGRRLAGVLVGLALSLGAWILGSRWIAARDSREPSLADLAADVQALLEERARAGPIAPADPLALVHEPIPEAEARILFTPLRASPSGNEYDPVVGWRYRGGMSQRIPFADRWDGEWTFRTNSLGLREDAEIAEQRPGLRVLVAGDSQTEGYCNNPESWPNQLEAQLASAEPGRTVDVLNAGKSGYSFYDYLGTLERFLALEPDVFVMSVYGGNDFQESLLLHHYFRRTRRAFCPECDVDRTRGAGTTTGVFPQALHQVAAFRHHPEERAVALEAASSVTAGIDRLCREHRIRLVCVYIPSLVDAQPWVMGETLAQSLATFGLRSEDLEITNRLAEDWIAFARGLGIRVVDLRAAIAAEKRPLYWVRDEHLNVEGNRMIAAALLPETADRPR